MRAVSDVAVVLNINKIVEIALKPSTRESHQRVRRLHSLSYFLKYQKCSSVRTEFIWVPVKNPIEKTLCWLSWKLSQKMVKVKSISRSFWPNLEKQNQ